MKISEEIKNIEVSKLSKSKWNPRENYGQIEELGDTIAQDGIINPLIVVERDGRYEVIVGERRRYAAEKLKMKTLPCRIAELSDKEIQMLIAIEEHQKEELNVIEKAKHYSNMIKSGWTQEDIASRVGIDRSNIAHIIQTMRLPEEAKKTIVCQHTQHTPVEKLLTYSKIDPIIRGDLPDKVANFLVQKIAKKGMPRNQIRKSVSNYIIAKRLAETERDKEAQKKIFQDLDEDFENILEQGQEYFEPKEEDIPKKLTIEFKDHVPIKDILAILEDAKGLGLECLCEIREIHFENPKQLQVFLTAMKQRMYRKYPYITKSEDK